MIKRKKSKQIHQFNATANSAAPQSIVTESAEVPSAFMATVSVSGSLTAVGFAFSLAYGWELGELLPLAAAPWFIYAFGKFIYLVIVLFSDVAGLFDFEPESKTLMMPITKE